jgi:hypothetical protein
MPSVRSIAALSLGVLLLHVGTAAAQTAELPVKYTGKPTSPEISASDLMTRLYIFADDSMMGRQVGTRYNLMGTAYIEREVRRMGLQPAGDNGGYFQNLPLYSYSFDSASTVSVGGENLTVVTDFLPIARDERRIALDGVPVVYFGSSTDSTSWISGDDAAGKIVVLNIPSGVLPPNSPALRSRIARAAAVLVTSLDRVPANQRAGALRTQSLQRDGAPPPSTPTILISQRVATLLLGPLENIKGGAAGKSLTGTIVLRKEQAPGRNVVALLPGSDPVLKNQYVAIGAHNDHIGFNNRPADHDSIRAFNMVARPQGADSPPVQNPTPEQVARIKAITDSLHALHGVRRDSIANGADDDGSGTVSVLEIAEAFAAQKTKPKRSILFVWHAGEEAGLWGSEFFTDHPTVPRDSIVAQLNMDMVGRGALADITGESKTGELLHGGPGYLQLVGSRRLSTELGDLMESVNTSGKYGFNFDYGMDTNGHPQNIYCRSDHYEYARYGIPIVFMTTGGHSDYHQVTDEPQYIDYAHMADIAKFVKDAATTVANLDHRVVVDKAKPDPKGRCVQ